MSDVRNYEEYRAQVLASLGEDYTVEDLRNEERFRSKVLDGLGMSYETEDLVNFEKYRLKVLQGIAGGGGSSSDFSTAEVTLNFTVENATLVETSLETLRIDYPSEDFNYVAHHIPSINNKCPVLLYQGFATAEGVQAIDSNEVYYESIVGTPVTTGGVSWNADLSCFEITGDGTITATLSLE